MTPSAVSPPEHSPAAGSAPALPSQLTHLDTGISRGGSSKGKNAKDPAPGSIPPGASRHARDGNNCAFHLAAESTRTAAQGTQLPQNSHSQTQHTGHRPLLSIPEHPANPGAGPGTAGCSRAAHPARLACTSLPLCRKANADGSKCNASVFIPAPKPSTLRCHTAEAAASFGEAPQPRSRRCSALWHLMNYTPNHPGEKNCFRKLLPG